MTKAPKRDMRFTLFFLLSVLLCSFVEGRRTLLDRYVRTDDDVFDFEVVNSFQTDAYTAYVRSYSALFSWSNICCLDFKLHFYYLADSKRFNKSGLAPLDDYLCS
jgi:hypothetical protein